MTRTRIKSSYEGFEYEDGGKENGKNGGKEGDDGSAYENLEFAFPPGMTLCVTSAMVFDTDRAQRPPSSGI